MLTEARKTQDLASTMNASKKFGKPGQINRRRATQGPTKQQRIDQKIWDEKIKKAKQETQNNVPQPNLSVSPGRKDTVEVPVHESTENVPDQLFKAMTLLQSKYEKNLEVIDILFQEKKSMEDKVQSLETKLVESSTKFETAIGIRTSNDADFPKTTEEAAQYSSTMAAELFSNAAAISANDSKDSPDHLLQDLLVQLGHRFLLSREQRFTVLMIVESLDPLIKLNRNVSDQCL